MGKYTDKLRTLDKLPQPGPEGGEFRSQVFATKNQTPTPAALVQLRMALGADLIQFQDVGSLQDNGRQPTTRELIDIYVATRRAMDAAAEVTSALEVVKTAVEETLADRYENEGLDTVKTDDGITVRHQPEPYAQVTDPDELREWFKAEGMERSLNPAWGTVNALAKQRLLNAEEPMPGVAIYNKNAHFAVIGLKSKKD
jgi:hypothetical protein